MATTSHLAALPIDESHTLVAQIGQRGCAQWTVVGTVVRSRHGLVPSFTGKAVVCEPAWRACLRDGTSGVVRGDSCRFGVLLHGSVHVIAEAALSPAVIRETRAIVARIDGQSAGAQQDRAQIHRDWARFFRGGRLPRVRSTWPRG